MFLNREKKYEYLLYVFNDFDKKICRFKLIVIEFNIICFIYI